MVGVFHRAAHKWLSALATAVVLQLPRKRLDSFDDGCVGGLAFDSFLLHEADRYFM